MVILSLLQAGCPAACQPAARCPMCPALGVPRGGTAPGSAASGPGSSSAHRCRHRTHKRTYLRHKHACSPAHIHVCAHACMCLWLSTPRFLGIDVKPGCTFECFVFVLFLIWKSHILKNTQYLKLYTKQRAKDERSGHRTLNRIVRNCLIEAIPVQQFVLFYSPFPPLLCLCVRACVCVNICTVPRL